MSEERRRILDLLSAGKITVDEAEKLMEAIGEHSQSAEPEGDRSAPPKFLHVQVEPKAGADDKDRVNIKIPLVLIRAGMKLGSLLPDSANTKLNAALNDKGIDFDLRKLSDTDFDSLVSNLSDLSIDVDDISEKVRIFCK